MIFIQRENILLIELIETYRRRKNNNNKVENHPTNGSLCLFNICLDIYHY